MPRITSNDILDEQTYWDIIEKSLGNATDQQSQLVQLVDILQQYPTIVIRQFDLRTAQLLYNAHTDELWCAATIMNKHFTPDDNFLYFKAWLISRGKDVYYNALANPDSLVGQVDPKVQLYDFEAFLDAPAYAFKIKTGVEFPAGYPKDFPYSEEKWPVPDFYWQTDSPADMRSVCPRLFDLMFKKKRKIKPAKKTQKKRR